MAETLSFYQVQYSQCTYDNGILIIQKRTGETIRHKNVPQSVFRGFLTTGNTDTYYHKEIEHNYPIY